MTDLERAHKFMQEHFDCQDVICTFASGCGCAAEIVDLVAAARREGAEHVLSSLSYPNRSALRESVRENLEQQYANIFGKRCSTDAARRLAECALETTVDFLVRFPLGAEAERVWSKRVMAQVEEVKRDAYARGVEEMRELAAHMARSILGSGSGTGEYIARAIEAALPLTPEEPPTADSTPDPLPAAKARPE